MYGALVASAARAKAVMAWAGTKWRTRWALAIPNGIPVGPSGPAVAPDMSGCDPLLTAAGNVAGDLRPYRQDNFSRCGRQVSKRMVR